MNSKYKEDVKEVIELLKEYRLKQITNSSYLGGGEDSRAYLVSSYMVGVMTSHILKLMKNFLKNAIENDNEELYERLDFSLCAINDRLENGLEGSIDGVCFILAQLLTIYKNDK